MKYFALDVYAYDCNTVWVFEGKGKTVKEFKVAVAAAMRYCVRKEKKKNKDATLHNAWAHNAHLLCIKDSTVVAIFAKRGFTAIAPTVVAIDGNEPLSQLENELK